MIKELLNMMPGTPDRQSLLDYLNSSTYDELVEIDLNRDHFKFLYNINDKYHVPGTEGSFEQYYSYAVEHQIHPEDCQAYA